MGGLACARLDLVGAINRGKPLLFGALLLVGTVAGDSTFATTGGLCFAGEVIGTIYYTMLWFVLKLSSIEQTVKEKFHS